MSPKLMLSPGLGSGQTLAPGVNADEQDNDLLRAYLLLLAELEASLDGSREALLALDLSGIERGTGQQIRLLGELTTVKARLAMMPTVAKLPVEDHLLDGATSEFGHEIRLSAERILEAARLHAAILSRSMAKLRVLGNMLAGSSVNYDPVSVRDGTLRRLVAATVLRESKPCRA